MKDVKHAAEIMDRVYPGWHQKVSTGLLDLRHGSYCILGQVDTCYGQGQRRLVDCIGPDATVELCRDNFVDNDVREDWIAEINMRCLRDRVRDQIGFSTTAPEHAEPVPTIKEHSDEREEELVAQ